MKKINIKIINKPTCYDIIIDSNLIRNINNFIISNNNYSSFVLVYDSNVPLPFIDDIKNLLNNCILIPMDLSINTKKSIDQFMIIQSELIRNNIDKNTLVISIGGGSLGDLVGFVSSTYYRGIDYIQIPTTLLSMIDSSIGGKTGLDLKKGKNLIGTFYHPKAVLISTEFLQSLNNEEIISGLFEAIKYGITFDVDLFLFIKDNKNNVFKSDILLRIIEWCCKIKSDIVIEDEKDGNIRNKLNFGHTIGHPIESIYEIRHGEAVAIGMLFAARLSKKMNTLNIDDYQQIVDLINHFDLPKISINVNSIINKLTKDKKRINGKNNFILLNSIGSSYISDDVNIDQIKEILLEI